MGKIHCRAFLCDNCILSRVYLPERSKKWHTFLVDFAKKIGKPDPEDYVNGDKWKARQGGSGLPSANDVKIRFTNCTTEDHAKIYRLVRPSDDELTGLFVPFGRVAPELGRKIIHEVIVLDQRTNIPILSLQPFGQDGYDYAVKVRTMNVSNHDELQRMVGYQIRKFNACRQCLKCESICRAGAISVAGGSNKNTYAEANITSPFFSRTIVRRNVGNYIANCLLSEAAFLLVLTGHAGDGKTSLLVQILLDWRAIREGEGLDSERRFRMPNGTYCTYVKDFSADVAETQTQNLRRYVELVQKGEYVFLVANTGPLIASFGEVFSRKLQTQLVNAIDRNDGTPQLYEEVRVAVFNAATLDNSTFVKPFLTKVLSPDLWSGCGECDKRGSCPIFTNGQLVGKASDRVTEFVVDHYIWKQEHDRKRTIRQIVAHLAYSLTGGLNCTDVRSMTTDLGASQVKFNYLFSNLFFGYEGFKRDRYGDRLDAIREIQSAQYDQRRLNANERLFIQEDLQSLLPEVRQILEIIRGWNQESTASWRGAVRRAYILFDTDPDLQKHEQMLRNVFSPQFPRYLQLRRGESATASDRNLIVTALQMLFTGVRSPHGGVKITFMRSTGVTQSVQMVLEELGAFHIKLKCEDVNDFDEKETRKRLFLSVKDKAIHAEITLPMLNYFDEIRRGAIATNIDPMLSHGIDSIKAQLISSCTPEENLLTLAAMSNHDWTQLQAEYDPARAVWTLL